MAAAGVGGVHPRGQHLPTVSGYISSVVRTVEVAASVYAADHTLDNCEKLIDALDDLLLMIDALEPFLPHEQRTSLLDIATSAYNFVTKEKDFLDSSSPDWAQFATLERNGGRGAPKICISRSADVLRDLIDFGYSQVDLAGMFGVSRDTIARRLQEEGIDPNSRIPFATIVEIVRQCNENDPYYGVVATQGKLRSMGLRVPRAQVRDALRVVNPLGTLARNSYAVVRRAYNVAGPNHLWHQDGNHKFIRWQLVIHGMIDGYSRRVVYLHLADNNRAETPGAQFDLAVQPDAFGCPLRVRGDLGTENNDVEAAMVRLRGHGSYIRGRSVHNQRIERLWRDVFSMCTRLFWELFMLMEAEGLLDPNNKIHLFCLQIVFKPRMRAALDRFRAMWDNHALSTEHNKTPLQLWLEGRHPNPTDPPEVVEENEYGVFADIPSGEDNETVHLDPPRWNVLTDEPLPVMYGVLHAEYGSTFPLQTCEDHGVSMYLRALECVNAIWLGSQ